MKNTLQAIIASIVDKPNEVVVDETEENNIVTLTITVAEDEVGKIIGKNGKIIRSLRNVMKIPAVKHNKKLYLSIANNS